MHRLCQLLAKDRSVHTFTPSDVPLGLGCELFECSEVAARAFAIALEYVA